MKTSSILFKLCPNVTVRLKAPLLFLIVNLAVFTKIALALFKAPLLIILLFI